MLYTRILFLFACLRSVVEANNGKLCDTVVYGLRNVAEVNADRWSSCLLQDKLFN